MQNLWVPSGGLCNKRGGITERRGLKDRTSGIGKEEPNDFEDRVPDNGRRYRDRGSVNSNPEGTNSFVGSMGLTIVSYEN